MLLKLFHNWSGGFGVIPIFHFFEILKNFSFWDYLENPLRYVGVPGDKKVSTQDKKTFDIVFYVELSGDSVEIH